MIIKYNDNNETVLKVSLVALENSRGNGPP